MSSLRSPPQDIQGTAGASCGLHPLRPLQLEDYLLKTSTHQYMQNHYVAVVHHDLSTEPVVKESQSPISRIWNGLIALYFPLTEGSGYINVYDLLGISSGTLASNFIVHVVYDVSPSSASSPFGYSLFLAFSYILYTPFFYVLFRFPTPPFLVVVLGDLQ
jgi:hypothetical protein